MAAITLQNICQYPVRGVYSLFTRFVGGQYSLVKAMFFSFVLFTLNMLVLELVDAMLSLLYCPEYTVVRIKAVIFASVVLLIHVGLWSCSRHAFPFFAFCLKALIAQNTLMIMVYLMVSFDFVRIDQEMPIKNPNIPVRLR